MSYWVSVVFNGDQVTSDGGIVIKYLLGLVALSMAFPSTAYADRWSDPYIGVHGGWLWSETEADNTRMFVNFAAGVLPLSFDNDAEGFMGGVQAGVGSQHGGWYFGIEGDASWTDSDEQTSITKAVGRFSPRTTTLNSEMDWFGTLRLRLGVVASPNLLVYATGGAAFADINHDMTSVQAGRANIIAGSSRSDFKAGWTVGGGSEWAFGSNWSVKAEYLYYDLGDTNVTLDNVNNVPFLNYEIENTGQIARIGINYRFSRPAPVSLK